MLTPMLTTSKLKLMSPIIASSAKEFADDLLAECVNGRTKIDCRRYCYETNKLKDRNIFSFNNSSRMTTWLIDMFTRTTLGVQLKDAKNPENEFALAFRTFMGENTTFDWTYSLSRKFRLENARHCDPISYTNLKFQ